VRRPSITTFIRRRLSGSERARACVRERLRRVCIAICRPQRAISCCGTGTVLLMGLALSPALPRRLVWFGLVYRCFLSLSLYRSIVALSSYRRFIVLSFYRSIVVACFIVACHALLAIWGVGVDDGQARLVTLSVCLSVSRCATSRCLNEQCVVAVRSRSLHRPVRARAVAVAHAYIIRIYMYQWIVVTQSSSSSSSTLV
jgi:hypothetical protein